MWRPARNGRISMGVVPILLSAAACRRPHAFDPGTSAAAATVTPAGGAASGTVTPKLEPSPEAQALSNAFEAVAQAIRPSVVRVDVEGISRPEGAESGEGEPDLPEFLKRFFDMPNLPPQPRQLLHGTGSGVIVDGAGDVLTNAHVVRGARKVTLGFADGRSFPARVVGTDPLTDVGVVRFEKPPGAGSLVAARMGDSDKLRIGEWSLAVGSPLGMDQTVTVGIISGVGATGAHFRFESGERVRKYIQTDAKINPGNSGGPLVNIQGEVVGINTLINVGPGGSYGFAIPINQAWQVAGVLIKEGHVRYPFIGVSVVSMTDVAKQAQQGAGKSTPAEGAYVGGVTAGGPAASAGIQPGDVITRIGGRAIKSASDVVEAVSAQHIGGTVPVEVTRDGATRKIDVRVEEYPSEPSGPTEAGASHIGVALQTLTPPLAESLGLDGGTKGAVITEVVPGSPADKAKLAPGDVIREIDKKPIASADDAVAAMRTGKGPRLLRITNASGTRYVAVTPQ
jgi:serine protease Do